MNPQLHIETRGSGTPIVFTHSFAGDVSHWSATAEHFEANYRTVAFDFSGHGKSPESATGYSIAGLAREIEAAAITAKLGSFILVGHSLGACAAAEYAGANPARVKALVLVDPPPAPGAIPPDQLAQMHAAVARDPYPVVEQFWDQQMFVDSRPETRERLLAGLRAMSRRAAAELTDASLDYDARPALLRYPGSKFAIVTPRNDTPLSLQNAVSGFAYTVLKGTGHWIQLDKPREFNQALDVFLKTVR